MTLEGFELHEFNNIRGPVKSLYVTRTVLSEVSGAIIESSHERTYLVQLNKAGVITELISFSQNAIAHRTVYNFDAHGRLIESITYENGASVSDRSVYSYDLSGKLIAQCVYGEDGKLAQKTSHIYNAEGKLSEWSIQYNDGHPSEITTHEYGAGQAKKPLGLSVALTAYARWTQCGFMTIEVKRAKASYSFGNRA